MAYEATQMSIVDEALLIGLKKMLLAKDAKKDQAMCDYFYDRIFVEDDKTEGEKGKKNGGS